MNNREELAKQLLKLSKPEAASKKGLFVFTMDDLADFITEQIRLARIEEIQLLIGTHNNDPSTKAYDVITVTRELLNERMAQLAPKPEKGKS